MKRTKVTNKKGITLIALVITIVIIIILATVTIGFTFGENGLIGRAEQAAELTEISTANEEMGLYLTGVKMEELQGDGFRLADYLSENIGNDGLEDFINNGDGYGQVSYNGHNFLVNLDDYTYTYIGRSDGSAIRRIEQVLGNNNESVPGISMVEAGDIETEDLGWRVLSVNSDGSVNLIANRNTGFEVSLSGINGYTNGVKALNEICSKLYGNLTEIKLSDGSTKKVKVVLARNAKFEDFYEEPATGDPSSTGYGGVWSTNENDSSAPNKITSTNNRWAPTIFAYEDIDPNNGISDGYSDEKIV